ncbi:unnamed protein product [Adineta ricciae]|uniref:RING-CH-type domain-containing protein n=1 Tax=Adineta ricciae TaxID=249248 RepID=A0A816EHA2_ADIRI|nr:unnamed protein product [Adineta ricciae]
MSSINISELRTSDDRTKQCRICLDTENSQEMISPCLCTGTLAYVHRSCLNYWRSGNANGRAFKFCDLCQFKYVIDTVVADLKAERERLIKYHLYVLRDLLAIILLIQSIIVGLGLLMQSLDKDSHRIENLSPTFIRGFAIYYLSASIVLLALIGFVALIIVFCMGGELNRPSFGTNRNHRPGSSSDSPNGFFLAVVIMVIVCAIIGTVVGIVLSIIIFKKILKHHTERLWLRQEAEKYIVKDFQERRHELEQYRRDVST